MIQEVLPKEFFSNYEEKGVVIDRSIGDESNITLKVVSDKTEIKDIKQEK